MGARPVVLGRVSGVFGTAGWVKVYSYTRPVDNILDYATWYLGRPEQPARYALIDARHQGKTLVAQLADQAGEPLADRDAAAALVGASIAVARSAMPALAPQTFYWCDLVGCEVYNRDDAHLGQVRDVLETGASDVLILAGERERLIPFVIDELVDTVDVDAGVIRVDWPLEA